MNFYSIKEFRVVSIKIEGFLALYEDLVQNFTLTKLLLNQREINQGKHDPKISNKLP